MVVLKILKVKSLFYTSIKSCISSVQLLSRVWILLSPWTAIHQTWLFITNSWGLPKLMSIESVMPSNQITVPSPFSSCPPFFPTSGFFQWVSSSHQVASIGVSASVSVLPMNIQDWILGWTGWISLMSKWLSRVFSNTTVQKHQFFDAQLSLWSNSHIHTWLLEKP